MGEGGRDFPGEYRLDVEDFGPIVKASVDLRPLTVFIGPSNTGKSYLSILMYALHQCFGDENVAPYGRRPRYRGGSLENLLHRSPETDEDTIAMLKSFRNWLVHELSDKSQPRLPIDMPPYAGSTSKSQETETGSRTALPSDVESYFRSVFEQAEGVGRYAQREIGRCFGVDNLSSLVRRSSSGSGARVELSIPRKRGAGTARYEIQLHAEGAELSGKIDGAESLAHELARVDALDGIRRLSQQFDADVYDASKGLREELAFSLAWMAEDIVASLLRPLHRNAYYLPADRTGVMHSHQVVVSTLVQSATTAGLRPSASVPILSGVLADFLSHLIEMSGEPGRIRSRSRRGRPRSSDRLAKHFEHDVLKGTVQLEHAESGYPSFDYRPEGWSETLPLMRASSMVSELAPVVLYLRHLVQRGDILIIEEPESHLHPAMQVRLTRQLAALVRAGIRVIVTTHSEWLLEELANLVRLSQVSHADQGELAGSEVALEPNQVGAWLFVPDASGEGSTVREIGLDESGLYPSGFDDVAVALHNDWAAISSRIGDYG